jgi:hypothetical protein
MSLALSGLSSTTQAEQASTSAPGRGRLIDGHAIFRFDTFGDEQLWTDKLRMHEVIENLSMTRLRRASVAASTVGPIPTSTLERSWRCRPCSTTSRNRNSERGGPASTIRAR